MTQAILHAELHQEMDSSLAPEQVAEAIEALDYDFQFGVYDGDDLPFSLQTDEIVLDGIIRRWHGTESHIEVMTEVSDHLLLNTVRNIKIGVVLLITLLISLSITQWFVSECVPATVLECDEISEFIQWQWIILFVALWIIGLGISRFIYVRDPMIKCRWQAQQAMGTVIDDIFQQIATMEATMP